MSINHYEINKSNVSHIFKLDTPSSSYCIGVFDDEGFVGNLYYGERLEDYNLDYAFRQNGTRTEPSKNNRDRGAFNDSFPFEYPTSGIGDYRETAFAIETLGGFSTVSLTYVSYDIYEGKDILTGLPASFGEKEEVATLVIHCIDQPTGLKVDLQYSAFNDTDVITRSVKIINGAKEDIFVTKAYSASIDMDSRDFLVTTLHGSWARERHIDTAPLTKKKQVIESLRGESSHQDHQFIMLKTPDATDEHGDVYAMHLVYSGCFRATAMVDQFDQVRMTMGIQPDNFRWKLTPNEEFQTPEVVCVYSHEGTGHMTRTLHDFYRKHLIRSPYLHKKRPVLINNWEATYFDFDTDKLIAIAREASKHGIEMLVMDDGWFGDRNDDTSALGDWIVNEDKIKGGLKNLVDEVNALGMKFGIWFEPEMISPNSNLYREHPDWAIAVPGREPVRMRDQYVLDLSRRDVIEYTYEQIAKVLRSANIEYVKWDMNRQLSDIGSVVLPADQMGELLHRYVLAVYELQDRLLKEFPNLLLENCSGGGARFDPGMLYYSPQIWCSDDTDAIERLYIQEGTAMIYPVSTMGAHVSDCPNHAVGRVTPFETRGHVALFGTFGYELDVTKISEEDRNMIPEQVAMYHKYNDLIREGDYYRIANYSENHYFDCYGVVAKDKTEALYVFVQVLNRVNFPNRRIKFKGLDAKKSYRIEGEDRVYSGEALMKVGYCVESLWGDFKSRLIHIVEA